MTVQRGQRYILGLAFVQWETGSRNYAKRLSLYFLHVIDDI